MFRSELQERLSSGGASARQIAVIEIRGVRLAAGGDALIRRQGRVGDDQVDAVKRHAEFFGDELHLRRGHALPEFFFSGVGGHAAVRGDGDPGIDFIGRRRIRRRIQAKRACAGLRFERSERAAHAEADDQRAGSLDEGPA